MTEDMDEEGLIKQIDQLVLNLENLEKVLRNFQWVSVKDDLPPFRTPVLSVNAFGE